MKARHCDHNLFGRTARSLLLFGLGLGLGLVSAQAQDVRIRFSPVSPQDLKDAGLPSSIQKSGGAANVGVGQPVYMEALVETGTVVNAVNWSLIGVPDGSQLTELQASPFSNEFPSADGGDRIDHFVAGRAVLVPDVHSTIIVTEDITVRDYEIRTDVVLTNGVLSFTNTAYGAVYLGQKHYLCVICHADKQAGYEQTDHASAFRNQITGEGSNHFNENCISCHVLGYDETPGADNNGFDDIAADVGWTFPGTLDPTNWTGMPPELQSHANVQCENCHGPASRHMRALGDTNAIDVTLSAGTCGQCHDSKPYHVKVFEWEGSRHSTGYVFRFSGSCVPCHSSRGFIKTHDPYYSSTGKNPRGTTEEGLACAACHDPHTPGMGDHQLRDVGPALLSNGVYITYAQAGSGVLCMQCHHARRDADTAVLGTANSRFGPHHGNQGDMLAGENGFEYGLNMPSSRHLLAVTNSCVGCHMQMIKGTDWDPYNTMVGGHTFKISNDLGTPETDDDVHVTEVCSQCHVEKGTFDFGGEDYDRDGVVEGVQTEIAGLMDQLGRLLPPVGSPTVSPDSSYDLQQKQAAWNYLFVEEDQSHGVHNPKYAAALLQASIDDMQGGVDVDRDGLIDSWEMTYFGSLTAQTGDGDADEDGLNNRLEQEIGTNPMSKDTDNDTFTDRVELEAGSDPLNIADTPPQQTIIEILPAMELGYVPGQAGVPQQFQAVNRINDGAGWTDVGPTFVSSNAMSYQLISVRDSTSKYFRVVEPE